MHQINNALMDESDRKMKQILDDIPDMLLDGNYTPNLKQAIETLKSLASVMDTDKFRYLCYTAGVSNLKVNSLSQIKLMASQSLYSASILERMVVEKH